MPVFIVIYWKAPPDHVIPSPEEMYIYSPLGTAFKVRGEGAAKNPSIITMYVSEPISILLHAGNYLYNVV